jgi:hypothetical protein
VNPLKIEREIGGDSQRKSTMKNKPLKIFNCDATKKNLYVLLLKRNYPWISFSNI